MAQTEYRYAMYNRPVWGALYLSQPYTIDTELIHPDIIENRRHHNRAAHSILITHKPLTPHEVKSLELVDITAQNRECRLDLDFIDHLQTRDDVSAACKTAVVDMIRNTNYIRTMADVDMYADKYMAQGIRASDFARGKA